MFARAFCKKEFESINHNKEFVQINHSLTLKKGTIRGLHYQKPPHSETKLIRCISGSVFDVVVDLRKNSPTRLKWIGVELSKSELKMIYIPDGCAHGFQTLEDNSELLYHHTEYYTPEAEASIRFDNKAININWPLEVADISDKDNNSIVIDEFFGVEVN
jgi:dTDP-4-dehydrorhamnose 3,5-epimerase